MFSKIVRVMKQAVQPLSLQAGQRLNNFKILMARLFVLVGAAVLIFAFFCLFLWDQTLIAEPIVHFVVYVAFGFGAGFWMAEFRRQRRDRREESKQARPGV